MADFLRGPLPEASACASCPLSVGGFPERPVQGLGSRNPKFVIIGEGPGKNEAREGQPFIGQSGQLLNKALAGAKVSRSDTYITNATLCLPNGSGPEKDRQVKEASKCCNQRLQQELAQFKPDTPLLVLGKAAAEVLIADKFKITELAGTYHEVYGHPSIVSVHPAAMLHAKGESSAGDLLFWGLCYDVAKADQLSRGFRPEKLDIQIEFVDPKRAEALIEDICNRARLEGEVAVDLETIGVLEGDCTKCPSCLKDAERIKEELNRTGKLKAKRKIAHTALESLFARITAVGLAVKGYAIALSWHKMNQRARELFRQLMADLAVIKDFHNKQYDMQVLHSNGIEVLGKTECTLYMHHAGFPGFQHRLQRVVSQFTLVPAWKAEYRHGQGTTEELLTYNAQDTLHTRGVKAPLMTRMRAVNVEKVYATDMAKVAIAMEMQRTGAPLDLERNRTMHEYFVPRVVAAREGLGKAIDSTGGSRQLFFNYLALEKAKRRRKIDPEELDQRIEIRRQEVEADWEEFNPNAGDQIVALLKACGVKLTQITKTGKLSTKKDILESLIAHPVVKTLLEFRQFSKLNNTFVEPLPDYIMNDGRIHVLWSPNKVTGRWGSSDPINMQNWGKGEESDEFITWLGEKRKPSWDLWAEFFQMGGDPGTPNLRWQIAAPPGWVIVGSDKSQLEARVIAQLAKDEFLCSRFSSGADIHAELAPNVFPDFTSYKRKSPQWNHYRKLMKTFLYAYMYGALPTTSWKQLIKEGVIIPLETVIRAFKFLKSRFKSIPMFHASLYRKVLEEKCLRDMLLNRARFVPTGLVDEGIIKNWPIQTSAAGIVDTEMIGLHGALAEEVPTAKIILQGHDAISTLCRVEHADRVAALHNQFLDTEYTVDGVRMRYPCETDIGPDWGST